MSDYTITISRTAKKQLDILPEKTFIIVIDTIKLLAFDPRPIGCKKLKGREGYRIRKGDYRIIYDIYETLLIVEVVAIGHRRDVYR